MATIEQSLTPTHRTDASLTLHYQGMTVRLEAGDPRIAFIEFLLFRELPPPLSRPAPPPPEPEPPEAPPFQVPAAWLAFWASLPDGARRLLEALCEGDLTTPQLEARLALARGGTLGPLISIARSAANQGVADPIRKVGRGRDGQRRFLSEEARPVVAELSLRQRKVREALDELRQ